MRHTCDTARSGSEKGNTCVACHEELRHSRQTTGYGDLLGEWLRYTARISRARATSSEPGR